MEVVELNTAYMTLLRDLVTQAHADIKSIALPNQITEFVTETSQSELIFLLSIVLAVLLFVVILPVYEAFFGDRDSAESSNFRSKSSSSGYESGSMRVYKPGVGIVTLDADDVISAMSNTTTSSSGSSSRSVGSHGSGSMETIEESEEEDAVDMEDDDEEQDEQELNASVSSLDSVTSEEPQEAYEDEAADEHHRGVRQDREAAMGQEAAAPQVQEVVRSASCSAIESFDEVTDQQDDDAVQGKVKYYEFLRFLNSDGSPRNCTIEEDTAAAAVVVEPTEETNTQEHHFVAPTPQSPKDEEDARSATSELTSSSQRSTGSLPRLRSSIKKKSKRTLKKLSSTRW